MSRLLGSVGDGGQNIASDVQAVQYLLSRHGMEPGSIDRICGRNTIAAIRRFQAGFMSRPDGVVDVEGGTWMRLAGRVAYRPRASAPANGTPPARPGSPAPRTATPPPPPATGTRPSRSLNGSVTELVAVPARNTVNVGLRPVSNAVMTQLFGAPRADGRYTVNGGPLDNPRLQRAMETRSVGPFRVTGLRPAVDSMAAVFTEVRAQYPHVYQRITSGGMLNCRYVRGSTTSISNHSWGTAIDLGFDGAVDRWRDNKVYFGLTQIAPIFNRHGWYWGAVFRREDGMHFEASRDLAERWAASI